MIVSYCIIDILYHSEHTAHLHCVNVSQISENGSIKISEQPQHGSHARPGKAAQKDFLAARVFVGIEGQIAEVAETLETI